MQALNPWSGEKQLRQRRLSRTKWFLRSRSYPLKAGHRTSPCFSLQARQLLVVTGRGGFVCLFAGVILVDDRGATSLIS